jgi:hypothetical protein
VLTIAIQNDGTGTDSSANYTYRVYVNRRQIGSGEVRGHIRKDGWAVLLRLIAEIAQPSSPPPSAETAEEQDDGA